MDDKTIKNIIDADLKTGFDKIDRISKWGEKSEHRTSLAVIAREKDGMVGVRATYAGAHQLLCGSIAHAMMQDADFCKIIYDSFYLFMSHNQNHNDIKMNPVGEA